MSELRQAVPAGVKRELRRESGFGCAFCGVPFVQYHHIVPWAEDQHFRPADMMVVCPNHHHACTVGAIPERAQRDAKRRAKNVIDGLARGVLYVTSNDLTVEFAGGTATNIPNLIQIGGVNMLRCTRSMEGVVQVSAIVQNAAGTTVATIIDNEWTVSLSDVWDFEAYERHATIRHGPSDIGLAVDCRNGKVRFRGKWFLNSKPISVSEKQIDYNGMIAAGQTFKNPVVLPHAVAYGFE